MIEFTEEYKKAANRYKKTFGYGVPLAMIPPVATTSDLITKIEECIKANKDDLLNMYGVSSSRYILF